MKTIKYLSAFALGLVALLGIVQFVIILSAFLKQPEASLIFLFGEVIGILIITVSAAAGATLLLSSAQGAKQGAEDAESGT